MANSVDNVDDWKIPGDANSIKSSKSSKSSRSSSSSSDNSSISSNSSLPKSKNNSLENKNIEKLDENLNGEIIDEKQETCHEKMEKIDEECDSQDDASEKFVGLVCDTPCKHCPYYLMGRLMPSTGSIG